MVSERNLGRGLALALLVLTGRAQAQPSAAQRETARELMAEGRRLHERGDLKGALGRFSAADAIMNVPTTTFEVAATQAELGKLIEARESLLRLLGTHQGPADPEPFNEARAKALVLSQQLVARFGSIVVGLHTPAPEGPRKLLPSGVFRGVAFSSMVYVFQTCLPVSAFRAATIPRNVQHG